MNLILQAIKSLFRKLEAKIPKKLSDLVNDLNVSIPDWNQNNPKGEGYIKNRPFYEERIDVVWVAEQNFIIDETGHATIVRSDRARWPNPGDPFEVIFDGVSYKGVIYEDGDNCTHTDFTTKDGYEVTIYDGNDINTSSNLAGEHTIKIIYTNVITHKIDEKYFPGKMNATDPVGTGSFSMNRRVGTNIGSCSHVEGEYNAATHYTAHAEGYSTTASGDCSHTEGYSTTASGDYSHAEGYSTTASNYGSHAEGRITTASGGYAHTEGYSTTASGYCSHTEGSGTTASGYYSHAEGLNTTAASSNQHAQGKYNVVDNAGKYAHIVGNGKSGKNSNAHTLDWNGLGWFAGGLKIGGTGQDDKASKNVLLEGDAIPVPETASVGQTLVVKSVDENGKPTEWEVVDAPTGGGNIDDEYINSLIDAKLEGVSALVDEINGEVI